MANLEVMALDTVTPQLRAPGVGDVYFFPRQVLFNDNVGIGTPTPATILNIGFGTPTTPASGIQFGTDALTNLYRSSAGVIKTDGSLTVNNSLGVPNGSTSSGLGFKIGGFNVLTNAGGILTHGTDAVWTSQSFYTNGSEKIRIDTNGNIIIGVDSATPAAKTLNAQSSRSGTDTNVGGGDLTIYPGTGTGTGTTSSLVLQSPVAVGSGTGAQTQTTGLTIKNGCAVPRATTVASLPAAASNTDAMLIVTDALTTLALGIGTAVVGGGANRVGVRSDGTNWIYSF